MEGGRRKSAWRAHTSGGGDGGLPLTHDSELRPAHVRPLVLRCEVLPVAHVDAIVLVSDPEDSEVDEVFFPLNAEAGGALVHHIDLIAVLHRLVPLHALGLWGVADEVDGCVPLGRHVARVLVQLLAPIACQGTRVGTSSHGACSGNSHFFVEVTSLGHFFAAPTHLYIHMPS